MNRYEVKMLATVEQVFVVEATTETNATFIAMYDRDKPDFDKVLAAGVTEVAQLSNRESE